LLVSAASFAQSFTATWEQPTVKNFVDMADDGATTQYLYNVEAKGFMVGHPNEWGTRASVGDYGDSIRMEALENGVWRIGCYPLINRTDIKAWRYVSCNNFDAQWIDGKLNDGGYPRTETWVVEKQANGGYKFYNTYTADDEETGDTKEVTSSWGIAEFYKGQADTRAYLYNPDATYNYEDEGETVFGGPSFTGEFYDVWQFVSVAEYEAYKEKIPVY